MRAISQRELRNDNAAVIRDVEAGETLTVTRNGVPVARLSPYAEGSALRLVKPAKHRLDPARLRRVRSRRTTAEVLDDLRGDR